MESGLKILKNGFQWHSQLQAVANFAGRDESKFSGVLVSKSKKCFKQFLCTGFLRYHIIHACRHRNIRFRSMPSTKFRNLIINYLFPKN